MGRPLAEEELVVRAKRGDAAAYEELVRAYEGIAFRTAYLVAGDAADAEEAAQDGFLKAYRALGRFRTGAPFRPWLLQIVANEARNRRRSAHRRRQLALRARRELGGRETMGAHDVPPLAASPEGALLSAERRERLLSALNALGDRDRLVVACRYLLELSEEETASALGCRRGTVKSRLARALVRLRAELGEDDG